MSNTLLTSSVIAKEALMRLDANLVMGGLVYRDYDSEFQAKVGDTVTIRKPVTFTAAEFSTAISAQAITENSTTVVLDKHLDVSFEITAKEMSLSIDQYSERIINPAMAAIAQKIDEYLCGLYADVPFYAGTAGTTPATLAAVAAAGKVLNINKAPMAGRNLVIDPSAHASLVVLDAFAGADKSGSTEALREASIGRALGFDTYMDQNIKAHANGTATSGNASGTAGDATIAVASLSAATATIKKGTLFTIADDTTVYTVTEDATGSSSAIAALKISPALKVTASTKAITFIAGHAANLAFHKNAFALVVRPLALPMGNSNAEYVDYNGLGIRMVSGYDMSGKKDVVSLDLLCGVKLLDPALACRLVG